MEEYKKFLESKKIRFEACGFEVDKNELNSNLFDFQRDIVHWALKKGKCAVFAGTGLGKCHGKGTKILMYDGSIKNVEDVSVGDQLMGPDSKPRNVLSLAHGKEEMFRVNPIKGEPFTCNRSHILSLKITSDVNKYKKDEIINISIDDYLKTTKKFKHISKLWRSSVDFNKFDVEVDPYIVGVWLGDGTKLNPSITNSDIEIINEIKKFADDNNLSIRKTDENNTTTFHLKNDINKVSYRTNFMREFIKKCVIDGEKRIPKEYLINSVDVRLNILAGLLDTDGYLIDNVFEICTKYKGLRDDILYLARSLGFAANSRIKKSGIKSSGFKGEYHRIFISGKTSEIPTKVKRKIAKKRKQVKSVLKTGFKLESIGIDEYFGFTLDGDHLYLLGDFTVTHNTLMELSWANQVHKHTNGDILILAPLAVSEQTAEIECLKFGFDVNICRSQNDVKPGINITNYEMLHTFDASKFIGVVLDESSILKAMAGKMRTQIIETFFKTPYKLACSATPSPNDHMELGNHCEFLNVMSFTEMLSMFFVHDGGETSKWRLKGHCVEDFWEWVSSWAVMMQSPYDLGYENHFFDLPELRIHEVVADKSNYAIKEAQTLNEQRKVMRETIDLRVEKAAEIANGLDEQCIIWCNLNDESEKLAKSINNSVEVAGKHDNEYKKDKMVGFANGTVQKLISKPSICGFGMNWQNCSKMIFVGLSHSFEQYYQAVRRCWRAGQTKPVDVWIITSEKEGAIVKNIQRKEEQFESMLKGMIASTQEITKQNLRCDNLVTNEYETDINISDSWTMHKGDNVEVLKTLPDNSIHYSVFSPPFSSLYTYSNSLRDMGNCKTDEEFFEHFDYLIPELYRVLMSGRLVSVHCMNLPTSKQHDGIIGLKDFRGMIIRAFQKFGFIYHSEVCIWKDPVIAMQRTKALGLLHKQIKKDSCMSRMGIPDYVVTFRKPGENPERVTHTNESFPVQVWQKYASPVWDDINQSDTLQRTSVREEKDERHICPLQLGVIERCIELWSNPGDKVLDPFAGIGSVPYQAVKMGRYGIGIELKDSYYKQAVENCKVAERDINAPKQFSLETFGVGNTQSTLF